jgi:hypothetical protein
MLILVEQYDHDTAPNVMLIGLRTLSGSTGPFQNTKRVQSRNNNTVVRQEPMYCVGFSYGVMCNWLTVWVVSGAYRRTVPSCRIGQSTVSTSSASFARDWIDKKVISFLLRIIQNHVLSVDFTFIFCSEIKLSVSASKCRHPNFTPLHRLASIPFRSIDVNLSEVVQHIYFQPS